MVKSAYTYETIDNFIIIIYDLDQGGMSVTNDLENIITKLKNELQNINDYILIYRDSNGTFDGIALNKKSEFSHFYGLGKSDKSQAITAAAIKSHKSTLHKNLVTGKVIYDSERGKYWKHNQHGYTNIHSPELGWFNDEEVEKILLNSQNEPQDKKQIALNAYCFDFLSTDPGRSGGYVMIFAENVGLARKAMFQKYGDKWGTSYDKNEFYQRFPPFMYLFDVIEPVIQDVKNGQ
jgi:hypothetical protein